MIRTFSRLTTLFGAGLVAAAFAFAGLLWPVILIMVFFIFWGIALTRGWDWVHSPCLVIIFCIDAFGLFLGLSSILLFTGAFLSLAGWDLADLSPRLRFTGSTDDLRGLQNRHLLRLGLTLALGLGLVLVAVNLKFHIGFGWVAIISLLAALGLGKMVSSLLKIN
jgi:hypothetical protein